jgi:hypothetical protein
VQKQEWKVYSLENTEIPDVFFTPRQGRWRLQDNEGHFCDTVIWGHRCNNGNQNYISSHCCDQGGMSTRMPRPGQVTKWVKPKRHNACSQRAPPGQNLWLKPAESLLSQDDTSEELISNVSWDK